MISIIASTIEQASKLGVSLQLDIHRNKQAPSISTQFDLHRFQFLHSSYRQCMLFVCPTQNHSLSSPGLTEEGGHWLFTKTSQQLLSSLIHRYKVILPFKSNSGDFLTINYPENTLDYLLTL